MIPLGFIILAQLANQGGLRKGGVLHGRVRPQKRQPGRRREVRGHSLPGGLRLFQAAMDNRAATPALAVRPRVASAARAQEERATLRDRSPSPHALPNYAPTIRDRGPWERNQQKRRLLASLVEVPEAPPRAPSFRRGASSLEARSPRRRVAAVDGVAHRVEGRRALGLGVLAVFPHFERLTI